MTSRPFIRIVIPCIIAIVALPCLAVAVRAQDQQAPQASQAPATPAAASAPSSPTAQANGGSSKQDSTNPDDANPKNDRIFKFIPNYTTVETPTKYVPLTVKQKFTLGAEDAFDPYSFLLAAILAGEDQARNEDAAWGQGLKGYGKRYAAGFGDATMGSLMTTGIFPSMLHEDPRYFRMASGGFWQRSGHAMKRLVVIRTDSGHSQFNISEFGGNAAAAAVALTYHSKEERNLSSFTSGLITQISIDVIANQLKEFWPDIRHKIFDR